jgi:hypothetical protein
MAAGKRKRSRRRGRGILFAALIAAAVMLACIAGVGGVSGLGITADADRSQPPRATIPACPDAAPVTVGQMTVPAGPIAGFCQPQLEIAAQIMLAAQARGIGTHTQTVGVMTAIGESGLRNLDYGDAAGPDSRGIFQQRDNGEWGTLEQRMDPYHASVAFFAKLTTVPGWQTMDPSALAHAVQRNADPYYYTQFWNQAEETVAALAPAAG